MPECPCGTYHTPHCAPGYECPEAGLARPLHGFAEAPPVVEISASQIGAWDTCQRKWAYAYIAGIRAPANASAALGVAVHEKLERHMLCGEAFDLTPREDGVPTVDAIAAQAAPYIPREWLAIEAPFRLAVTPRGTIIGSGVEAEALEAARAGAWPDGSDLAVVILNGRIDVVRDACTVMDWKTSKDVRRYAKTEADLETDPAAIIYAAAVETATRRRSYEGTRLEWVYLSTKLEGARKVSTAIQGVRRLPLLAPQLEGIVAARRAWKTPEDAPPNPAGCMAFGGCYFRDRCSINIQPQGPSVALGRKVTMTAPLMDLAALLKALPQQGAAPAAPTPTPATTAAPATPTPAAPATTADLASMGIDLSRLGGAANTSAATATAAAEGAPKPPLEIPPAQAPRLSTGGEGATAGYVLYVDCVPMGRECVFGHEIVRRAAAALAVAGIADWRAASYQEGRGALATQVGKLLAEHNASPVPRKAIIVDTASEAERACLDLFLAGAANVVRGFGR